MDVAAGTVWEIPVLLSITTGARRGEVLALRWHDVALDARRVRIDVALQRVGAELRFMPPKTASGVRSIGLPQWATERLRQHRREQAERLLSIGTRVTDNCVVCDRGDGALLDPSSYTHAFARLAREAGLTGVRLHDCRHAVGTTLARLGTPALTAKILGHASAAFTVSTYVHPDDGDVQRASAAIEAPLSR